MGKGTDGNPLVPKQPRSLGEKILGVIGGVAATAWIFNLFLRIIDTIARVQTVMTLQPYAHHLVTWWAQLVELILAVTLIVAATRIEQARETGDAPRIILLSTREPTPVQRRWLWMKVAAAGTVLAFLAAAGVFVVVKRSSTHAPQGVVGPKMALMPNPTSPTSPVPANKSTPDPKAVLSHAKGNVPPIDVPARPIPHTRPPQSAPIVIPIPDHPAPPKSDSDKTSMKYVAQISGQVVDAKSKPPGTLFVTLQATSNDLYLGRTTPADINRVAEALKKTGKITVLLNQSAGSYQIGANGLAYSMSITQIQPRTIYFFNSQLESACQSIKTIISAILGQVDCKLFPTPPPGDPNQPNLVRDFLVQSGLDMEIDL